MKEPARLIIPLWGEAYASTLISMTLPALLTPGNLAALCESFDVELVLVTETKLFDMIRESRSYRAAAALCRTRLVPIDDLMTDLPGDYGVVLTYALYRGFTDLGRRMTDTYLLFLNADFIVTDGSLAHVAKLMREGKRVIHAPSFRVVLEDVWPKLQAAVNPTTCTLDLPPSELVKLALAHKHVTVKARTVNQRLCHMTWMDQFYWYVDDATLICYQWPVALVAIKPERMTLEPALVWDYGFIPEAAPTAPRHFISDSDDFFMLEPQKRMTGEDMIRLGWITPDDIARNLSKWTTREQRECGKQMFCVHVGPLPANVSSVVDESRAYMADIYGRLDPTPQPHIGHGWLGAWFDGAKERMRGRQRAPAPDASGLQLPAVVPPSRVGQLRRTAVDVLRQGYDLLFGRLPDVGRHHPLWPDTRGVNAKIEFWKRNDKRLLWLSSDDSLFHRKLSGRRDPMSLLMMDAQAANGSAAGYDVCLCELRPEDLASLRALYERIRPLVKDGGEIVVSVFNKNDAVLRFNDIAFCDGALPDVDRSTISFAGSTATAAIRSAYYKASLSFQGNPLARAILTAAALLALAPLAWLANSRVARRDPSIYSGAWTSLMMEFTIAPRLPAAPAAPSEAATARSRGPAFADE